MDYKDKIDPELRKTARQMPFNRQIIKAGNIYQAAALRLVKIPKGISVQTIETEGYQRLPFKTEIFTPDDAAVPVPALIYIHGGALCYKAATYHKKLACIYASKAKCKVFFPDYHLAPKISLSGCAGRHQVLIQIRGGPRGRTRDRQEQDRNCGRQCRRDDRRNDLQRV